MPTRPINLQNKVISGNATILLISALSLATSSVVAQGPETLFINPLDLPVRIAGNFMELRNNHFHSGIDLKTNGTEGHVVRATADGWVSRIKISPWGYGKAVYINHPSGHTTVYAHLSRLHGELAATLLDLQYEQRSFSIDKYFTANELPVRQGDVIAYSGNTGGSTAPHLHYEVRRSIDQHPLDPQVHGIAALDDVHPTITGIRLYPLDTSSRVSPYPAGAVGFVVVQQNDSTYMLKAGSNPAAWGTVGLAVNTFDRYSLSHNVCGVRELSLSVDGRMITEVSLDEIDFGLQRYANAYMDYGLFRRSNMHYNRLYKLPNNRLPVYRPAKAPGVIAVEPGKDHAVQVTVTDASGNRSTLTFVLHGASHEQALKWPTAPDEGILFRYNKATTMQEAGVRFSLPANGLYEDTYLSISTSAAPAKALAPLVAVGNAYIPLHVSAQLAIDVQSDLVGIPTEKLLIVRRSGRNYVGEGGSFSNGKVTTNIRALGQFTVMLDTVPPVVRPVDLQADMRHKKGFKVRVTDDLSGIGQWVAKLNGQWILMEYEPKSHTLEHTFDKYSNLVGEHEFELEVTDERGNRSRITRRFTR